MSGSNGWRRGGHPYFPEFDTPQTNFGRASGTDFEQLGQFYGKFSAGPWDLTAGLSRRAKGNPAALFGADFNDPANRQTDAISFFSLNYQKGLSPTQQLNVRLSQSTYDYGGIYVYSDAATQSRSINDDSARGSHWNVEVRLLSAFSASHGLVTGMEIQNNYQGDQISYFESPTAPAVEERHATKSLGVFVQDQYQFNEQVSLSAGLRYDKATGSEANWSPRLGVVCMPSPRTVWKFLYGSAYRAPNQYELNYAFPDYQLSNPGLKRETIRTAEATIEHYLSRQTRILGSVYVYRMADPIAQVTDAETGLLQFRNGDQIRAQGLELEAEQQWDTGARLRASVTTQRALDANGTELSSSPRHMAKLNLSAPLFHWPLRLGIEGQWLAKRKTELGTTVGGSGIVNVTLWRPEARDGVDVSASVFNLLNRRFADPVGLDPGVPARDRIIQDGRTFRLAVSYYF